MKITRLAHNKQGRVNVYLNAEYAFSLSGQSLLNFKVAVGDVLTQSQFDQMQEAGLTDKAYDSCIRLLSLRPRSRGEISRHLKNKYKELAAAAAESILNRLEGANLVDDKAFAAWWAGSRQRSGKRSTAVVRSELFKKGIAKTIVDEVLLATYSQSDEVNAVKQLIEKKNRVLAKKDLTETQKRQKIIKYLASKGFSWEVIKQCVN